MAGEKLSALKAKSLNRPGRYGDGKGLWLQVRDAEHRSWLFRYVFAGKQRQMGLGSFSDVSLAEAREAAQECRLLVRQGCDPIEDRRKKKADASGAMTFRQVADRYLAGHEAGWRNDKHRRQWRATLSLACEQFGETSLASIDTDDVMRVLEPIWMQKTETASRLRGRIECVIDYAAARGWRIGENPARWRGHLAKLLPEPSKITRVNHHAALPWAEIGAFMAELRDEDGVAARALEFAILTAGRTGEVIGATWAEMDMQAALWTVPGERMKAGRQHRVPLSDAALHVLSVVTPPRDSLESSWVFPGSRIGRPLSNMGMMMLLRRMKRSDLTVHGFRSTFRDWCAEGTNYPRDLAEKALAHTVGDETERSYQRGDLLQRRREVMGAWADFCARPFAAAEVIPLRRAG